MMNEGSKTGRLVVVAEKRLSEASRSALKGLLPTLLGGGEVTFVAGLGRAAALSAGAEGGQVFYNMAEHIPLWELVGLVPWREVWLVAGGQVWCTSRH